MKTHTQTNKVGAITRHKGSCSVFPVGLEKLNKLSKLWGVTTLIKERRKDKLGGEKTTICQTSVCVCVCLQHVSKHSDRKQQNMEQTTWNRTLVRLTLF